jgi:type VI secretion system protein ImpB
MRLQRWRACPIQDPFAPRRAGDVGVRPILLRENADQERPMAESVHRKLERIRPPRVHITYEVETGGAIEMRELPFVMGVLGDFSGQPAEPLAKLKDRKFVEVTPDNFNDVLKSMKPHLNFTVDNLLSDAPDAGKLPVDLKFESLDDFRPENVAQQVEPIRKLLELRQQLGDLRGSLQGNEKLEEILAATISDQEKLDRLKAELGKEGGDDGQG